MKTSTVEEEASSPVDIAQLAAQARAAFEQKRIKECIALTNALVTADPDNEEARALQSVIQSGIQRDLNDARGLLEDSRNTGEGQKFRKAAEIILLKVLYLDPANEGAKVLLSYAKTLAETSTPVQTSPKPSAIAAPASPPPVHQEPATAAVQAVVAEPVLRATEPAPVAEPAPIVEETPVAGASHQEEAEESSSPLPFAARETASVVQPEPAAQLAPAAQPEPETQIAPAAQPEPVAQIAPVTQALEAAPVTAPASVTANRPVRDDEIGFTTSVVRAPKKKEEKTRVSLPIVLASIVLVGGVLLLAGQWRTAKPTPSNEQASAEASAYPASRASNAARASQPAAPKIDAAPPVSPAPAAAVPAAPVTPAPVPAAVPPAPAPNVRVEPPVQTGSLSLNSPVAAEIYMGKKLVGTTPTTLKLPAGRQTLEFRFRNRNTVVTYDVKANQTTPATVTFDTTVQINARPWAEVFLEGASRRSLGQTPLSDVRVPIGSVLVFENPNFPSKTQTHRVTDADSVIQVVFQ